jgi:hypothetical protein
VIAAVFGALLQRYLITNNASSHGFGDLIKMQSGRDADFLRENVSLLASKVGTLQAKLTSIDSLGQRVAREAGVAYTDPGLVKQLSQPHEATEVMDDVFTGRQPPTVESAQELGRKLDKIQLRLSRQADNLKLLDVALTRRSAAQARLPTAMPITRLPLSIVFLWLALEPCNR